MKQCVLPLLQQGQLRREAEDGHLCVPGSRQVAEETVAGYRQARLDAACQRRPRLAIYYAAATFGDQESAAADRIVAIAQKAGWQYVSVTPLHRVTQGAGHGPDSTPLLLVSHRPSKAAAQVVMSFYERHDTIPLVRVPAKGSPYEEIDCLPHVEGESRE
jgi:hypothetical protein